MIYVRRSDDLSRLPLKPQTVTRLRALGIHTIGQMFDDPKGLKDARKWCNRIIQDDGDYGLVDWGFPLAARSGKLYWSLNEQGDLTIYGRGKMVNHHSQNLPPWVEFREEIHRVLLEEDVKNVGAFAFTDCPNLKTVCLSEQVERIAQGAFQNCTALEKIQSPRQLTHWREEQFLSGAENRLYVGEKALAGTPLVQKLYGDFYISHKILMEYFGHQQKVEIPEGVEKIAPRVFENTPLEEVVLPTSLKTIGVCAFQRTHLKSLILPTGLKFVDAWAFHGIRELERVTLLGSRVQMAENAFAETPVEPYAKQVQGAWPSLLKICQVEEPGMEPFRRLMVAPNPDQPFGTKGLNRNRALRELVWDGQILLKYLPELEGTYEVPAEVYRQAFGWNPSGLSRVKRKNMPCWYCVTDDGTELEMVRQHLLQLLGNQAH